MKRFRQLASYAIISGLVYIIWLSLVIESTLGLLFLIFEIMMHALILIFAINNWTQRHQILGGRYSMRNYVDVFISTKNEPIDMLTKTIRAANNIIYPNKRVYLIDDGDRAEVQQLAKALHVAYLVRPDRETKPFKYGTLN